MKRILLTTLLLFTATVAYADDLTLKVTPPEADLIWRGLRELPVKDVEILMSKMRRQVSEQTQPKKVEEPKKDK